MAGKFEAPREKKSPVPYIILVLIIVFALIIAALFLFGRQFFQKDTPDFTTAPVESIPVTEPPEPTETEPPETTLPDPEHVVTTATVGAVGDLLMHMPVVDTARLGDGTYNFNSIFRFLREYTLPLDYAAANLETTLCGNSKPYSGFPMFNCPDDIVTATRDAGFDLMLTANNHSYDTGIEGYTRTLEVCHSAGFDTLGTMASAEEPKYQIKEINGINIGMICYTYETSDGSNRYPSLNGNPMYDGSYDLVNCFIPGAPQRFYDQIEGYLTEMKDAGAEATIVYIHWGVEYQTYPNDTQKAIAQKLCDLGVDVIIGGHPHVVQPVSLLESTVDPDHKTVCIYSLGNAVSNQRKQFMEKYAPYGHTEDGALFSVTFEKYSDGTVYLRDADVLPTWVNMHTTDGVKEYNIVPLDKAREEEWRDVFHLNDNTLPQASKSYDRTMTIVEEGLNACKEYLDMAKEQREQYYYDLVYSALPDAA